MSIDLEKHLRHQESTEEKKGETTPETCEGI